MSCLKYFSPIQSFFFSICTSLSDISGVELFLTSFDVLWGYFYVSLNLVTGPTVKFIKSMIAKQPFFEEYLSFLSNFLVVLNIEHSRA